MGDLYTKMKAFFGATYKLIAILSPFGFILSIVFFFGEAKNTERLVDNLVGIEQSLSTRHIGIFPDYLDKINELLSETSLSDTARIVVFEDVLFYGAFYDGEAFKDVVENLIKLSHSRKIVIAYYESSSDMRRGRMFREVIQESWMRQSDLPHLRKTRLELMDSLRKKDVDRQSVYRISDSIACERLFAVYRDKDRAEFEKRIKKILVPLYSEQENDFPMFQQIDDIKQMYLNKPLNTISFYDIYTMCQQITDSVATFYKANKIQLVPLGNYLSMSCWSNGEKVLFAFPGRFAADEIGFISRDNAILQYINTMLDGVINSSEDDS